MYAHNHKNRLAGLVAVMAAVVVGAGPLAAADPGPIELNPARLAGSTVHELDLFQLAAEDQPVVEQAETETVTTVDQGVDCPFSLGVAYSLYSDYIFRFVNFSEYPGEGREKPNHQLAVTLGYDLGDFGALSYIAWFEWYAAQRTWLGSQGGQNLQEADHTIEWSYSIDAIATDLALGATFYHFPNATPGHTFEYYVSLAHNDAWLWRTLGVFPDNDEGVLNPSFIMVHDTDLVGGVWMEFALEHPFQVCENFTLTPGWMVAIDGGYLRDDTFRFAGDQWSLVAEYDLGSLMQLPAWAGGLTVAGELYFNNAWGNAEDDRTIQDEFWGGMTVAWNWGG